MELFVLFGTFAFLLIIGAPVAFCLGVASFATIAWIGLPPVVVFQRLNSGTSVFALMAIPFFIYGGELMVRGDIARRLVALSGAAVGHLKGGLGQVNIAAPVLFGGISGSAAADASAIGGLMIPQMEARGYGTDYAVNITAGILPGLVLALALIVTAWAVARRRGYDTKPFPGARSVPGLLVSATPGLILIATIFGGVRSGFL